MPNDLFPDGVLHLLEKSLSWRSQGQSVIASNLANLETPNYKGNVVDFKAVLKNHLQGRADFKPAASHPRHLRGSPLDSGLIRESEEPLDLDQEMVNLSLNQLGYQTSVTMLIKKLDQLKTVIEGDRG